MADLLALTDQCPVYAAAAREVLVATTSGEAQEAAVARSVLIPEDLIWPLPCLFKLTLRASVGFSSNLLRREAAVAQAMLMAAREETVAAEVSLSLTGRHEQCQIEDHCRHKASTQPA